MAPPSNVTILGGGLTGLVTAYHLSHLLPPASKITLLESNARVGGWVQSTKHEVSFQDAQGEYVQGGVILESGPRSIRPKGSKGAAGMLRLIRDIDLESSLKPVSTIQPSARNRFILNPKTSPPTLGPIRLNPSSRNNPLSLYTVISAFTEPFVRPSGPPDQDVSVDHFLRWRFGEGVAELASAGMHGIYASSTSRLSAQAVLGRVYEAEGRYGSVIWGMIGRGWSEEGKREKEEERERWEGLGELGKKREQWAMYGFEGGLETLTNRLGEEVKRKGVDVRLDSKVTAIEPSEKGITITTSSGSHSTSHIIAAMPPPLLSPLLHLPHLDHNPSTSVGVINLVFPLPPSQIHPEGFGYLIPRSSSAYNPEGILGVVFDSSALPGLDSGVEGKVTKLTVMMGGPYWSTYPANPPDPSPLPVPPRDTLPSLALEHLRRVFPILEGVEPIVSVPQLHLDCIPTYLPGHYKRLGELHQAIQDGEWRGRLTLAGNGYGGVGVNDCVWSAESVAKAVARGEGPTGLENWAAAGSDVSM